MSNVVSRWTDRLQTRLGLLDRAQRSVRYWASRAGSAHGHEMLREAVARRALRQSQVAQARKVLARRSEVTNVSADGLALIAGFEGFSSKPYRDPAGVWTIGYGHTHGVGPNTPAWTREQALSTLKTEVERSYLAPLLTELDAIGLHLRQNEIDALTSAVYNLGPGILSAGSTMGDALRSRNRQRIADAFLAYDNAGGRTLPGLTRRRKAERAMFLKAT